MIKAPTDIPLARRARETLEKYKIPTVVKRDQTPAFERNFLSKKWIERVGWEAGNYPIYGTTPGGVLALEVNILFKILHDADAVPIELSGATNLLEEKEILIAAIEKRKIERRL